MYLVARFRANDYARWKRVFDEHEAVRVRHGGRGHRILRVLTDPDEYIVMLDFASEGGAQGFLEERSLGRAIDAAGVEGGAHHVKYTVDPCEQLDVVDHYLAF
jgi:hypothetical protein